MVKKVYNQKSIKSSDDKVSGAVCPDKRRRSHAIAPEGKANPLCPVIRVDSTGGLPGRGDDGAVNASLRDKEVLFHYMNEAEKIFASYGFIVTKDNSDSNCYGYESLYYKNSGRIDFDIVNTIRDLKGGKKKISMYNLGLIEEKDIYSWFENLVYRQNSDSAEMKNEKGESIFVQSGRFCNKRGKRSVKIQKVFKEGIGPISDCILLTMATHDKEVLPVMPYDTNLNWVQYATVNIGSWISVFLDRLRKYQKNRSLPWEFVGWVVEFQQGDEKVHKNNYELMQNGSPHVHIIFRGKWIGNIHDIAKLWPYCPDRGVDYMNKTKYERELKAKGKLKPGQHCSPIRLINYVTKYVSKCSKAVIIKGKDLKKIAYVHKGYAWLAFSGGRMYNVAREYKREKVEKEKSEWKYSRVV